MKLTVLHLLLILIGVIVISTIGYRFVSNMNEPFYVDTTPTCPKGQTFAISSGTCMDSTNPSFKTASAPICPTGSNFNPETSTCKIGAPALPDQYWLPPAERRNSTAPAPVNQSCVPTTSTDAPVSSTSDTASASGSVMDACGNNVSMTSLLGLAGAPPTDNGSMSPFLQNVQDVVHSEFSGHANSDIDNPHSSIPITPISDMQGIASNKLNDANALQGIQKIIHNELLSQKGMTTGAQMAFLGEKGKKKARQEEEEEEEEETDDSNNSPSNHQGHEFKRDCAKNTGTRNSCRVPDMSKYIRKDSIPCWGCTLPQ